MIKNKDAFWEYFKSGNNVLPSLNEFEYLNLNIDNMFVKIARI